MSMTEAQYLSPPEWDEEANRLAIAWDEESKRLRRMKEQLCTLGEALENADELSRPVRDEIGTLLDRQEERAIALESWVETLRDRLENRGVRV